MASVIIDVSATLLNQTAVNFLIRDTVRALRAESAAYQFVGEVFESPSLTEGQRGRLLKKFFTSVDEARVHAAAPPVPRKPILYFDPIYTLFGDLNEDDYVFVLDMTTLTNPDWHNPNVCKLYREAFRKVLRSRCHTIHISRNTLLTMRATLGTEGCKPSVLHLYVRNVAGAETALCYHPFQLGKYFLFVGSLELRKNVAGLICAFDLSGLARQGYKLVIAGGEGYGAAEIRAVAERTPNVYLLGYVSNGDLDYLYRNALAYVYPSFLEGFGVPLLEAMAYGLPCVAPTTGASPEVGGPDVYYVDPCDIDAIGDALRRLAAMTDGERRELGRKLQTRAQERFSFANYEAGLRKTLSPALAP